MKYLQWKPEYSVGDDSVDFEHQSLIEAINAIYAELEGQRDAAEVARAVADVHADVSAHFALEERMMRDANYHGYATHKNDHEKLLDEIRDLMDKIEDDPNTALSLLSDQLSDWFSGHFAGYDAQLHKELDHH